MRSYTRWINRNVKPSAGVRDVRRDEHNRDGTATPFLAECSPSLSASQSQTTSSPPGTFTYRPTLDRPLRRQAILAVGCDGTHPGSKRGALIVRKSWGSNWGDKKYAFVKQRRARNICGLRRDDWVWSRQFYIPLEVKSIVPTRRKSKR